jgi:hypothetical protein
MQEELADSNICGKFRKGSGGSIVKPWFNLTI